jgi:site-specific DNA recombinase
MLLRNQLYTGIVDVPEYGVRGKRGDFEPLISEDLFYRVQAVLSGRLPSTTPKQRAHPDFPLRGFMRCASCGRGLTGSWSKGSQRRLRFEMAPRESSARAGFQVALEPDGPLLIRELDDDVTLPRSARDRVGTTARIVIP